MAPPPHMTYDQQVAYTQIEDKLNKVKKIQDIPEDLEKTIEIIVTGFFAMLSCVEDNEKVSNILHDLQTFIDTIYENHVNFDETSLMTSNT
ncbi:hypothetical protein [Epinotia aporema granulovirus]|uniref:Uncharacterized protein n=1 Tax=Epinotia aporema granulovirus TaxID=166056 RepID=K4ER51_9BBAC|nr:hypothetical protein [Epinotia aporema granulovirus]AER41434.1 hypothetical protein [Epinotia aporema granulovirus]